MNCRIYYSFIIISLILIIPSVNAQEINVAGKATQKSVELIISDAGDIHVKHIVKSSSSTKQMDLIDGTIQNLTITDKNGDELQPTYLGSDDRILIFPSKTDVIIEYDLTDVLFQKNNLWSLDFLYLESTTFILPEKLEFVFINNKPVHLDDKRGFKCHGCQMTLEYFSEAKLLKNFKWENKEFPVEIKTNSEIESLIFDQTEKSINFDVYGENNIVTTIIPLELLWGPYTVLLDNEKIFFHEYDNGTHAWISFRSETAGEISVIGTTVVPEFPLFAPLAISFLMVIIFPFVKKLANHR